MSGMTMALGTVRASLWQLPENRVPICSIVVCWLTTEDKV